MTSQRRNGIPGGLLAIAVFIIALAAALSAFNPSFAEGGKKTAKIMMILWRGETSAEKGFRERLSKTPGVDFTFGTFDAGEDNTKLAAFLEKLDPAKYDFYYTFGTTVTEKTMKKIKDKPVIFNVVSRPVQAGLVKSMESSGNNATGVSNLVPMESALKVMRMFLTVRRIAFVYDINAENSRIQMEEMKVEEARLGFILQEIPFNSKEGVSLAMKNILDVNPDVVIFPSDSAVVSASPELVKLLNKHRIPSVATVPQMVEEHGALVGIGPDYAELGKVAAASLQEIMGGKTPAMIPVKTAKRLQLVVNMSTARALGVALPVQLLSMSKVVN